MIGWGSALILIAVAAVSVVLYSIRAARLRAEAQAIRNGVWSVLIEDGENIPGMGYVREVRVVRRVRGIPDPVYRHLVGSASPGPFQTSVLNDLEGRAISVAEIANRESKKSL